VVSLVADVSTRFPILGPLTPGTKQRHEVTLPGAALANDRWPVITIAGSRPGPVLFVNAGVHGAEYPAIESVIQLSQLLEPDELSGTVVLLPVLNLPAFRQRSMFVCPVDNVNPNRMFPGDPQGSYSEQLVYALTEEFIAHADYFIDLHGGDLVEELIPFSICRRGDSPVEATALELSRVFGLPYVLAVARDMQQTKGTLSYNAGAGRGVPSFIAEAGSIGLLRQEDVDLLVNGVLRVLAHLGMRQASVPPAPPSTVLTDFVWLYCQQAGLFYPSVSIGDMVEQGRQIGRVGSLFGDTLEEITAPVSGRVLFVTVNPSVQSNSLLMGIGVE
jgi:predicted deacylase